MKLPPPEVLILQPEAKELESVIVRIKTEIRLRFLRLFLESDIPTWNVKRNILSKNSIYCSFTKKPIFIEKVQGQVPCPMCESKYLSTFCIMNGIGIMLTNYHTRG